MNKDIRVYSKKTHSLNTLNGILNEKNLEFAKQTMLFDAMREHTSLIKTKQHYPHNDISDVEMELDCVIMSKKRYDKLIKIESTMKQGEVHITNNEVYLKFPKLEP